jgi:hypothetical protein
MCESPFCTAALHTFCCDPPLEKVPEDAWYCPMHALVEKIFCGVCAGGENDDLMLLCDFQDCKGGYHMYCLNPPMLKVPEGEWLCPQHDGSNGATAGAKPGTAPLISPSGEPMQVIFCCCLLDRSHAKTQSLALDLRFSWFRKWKLAELRILWHLLHNGINFWWTNGPR